MRSLYRLDTPPIYNVNDQAALQRMMFRNGSQMRLDFETDVCLNLFSATPRANMLWSNHSLISRLTGFAPALVHHNGGCGRSHAFSNWMAGYHAHTLDCHVRSASGSQLSLSAFERRYRKLVHFVDPHFAEVVVNYRGLCGARIGPTSAQRANACVEA